MQIENEGSRARLIDVATDFGRYGVDYRVYVERDLLDSALARYGWTLDKTEILVSLELREWRVTLTRENAPMSTITSNDVEVMAGAWPIISGSIEIDEDKKEVILKP